MVSPDPTGGAVCGEEGEWAGGGESEAGRMCFLRLPRRADGPATGSCWRTSGDGGAGDTSLNWSTIGEFDLQVHHDLPAITLHGNSAFERKNVPCNT